MSRFPILLGGISRLGGMGPLMSIPPAENEILEGLVSGTNGSDGNAVFTLQHRPKDPRDVKVWNGIRQVLGVHYSLAGRTVTFIAPFIPLEGDVPLADYDWEA